MELFAVFVPKTFGGSFFAYSKARRTALCSNAGARRRNPFDGGNRRDSCMTVSTLPDVGADMRVSKEAIRLSARAVVCEQATVRRE